MGGRAWSPSTIGVVAVFSAYMCYSGYILHSFFIPESAPAGEECYRNILGDARDHLLDLKVFVSTEKSHTRAFRGNATWEVLGFKYSTKGMEQDNTTLSVQIPTNVQRQRTAMYAHVLVAPSKGSKGKTGSWSVSTTSSLIRTLPVPPPSRKYFLLTESPPPPYVAPAEPLLQMHWVPSIKVQIVHDFTCFSTEKMPRDVARHYQFHKGLKYTPAVSIDEFQVRNDQIASLAVNSTTPTMELQVALGPVSIGWWRMYANMQDSLEMMKTNMGADEKDTDDVRRMFTETSPILLAVTMVVSLLHLLFDILAFKNDVAFWRARKTPEGLSLRGIMYSVFAQMVVLLYLIENESSFLVRFSVGLGLVIDCWKLLRLLSMQGQLSHMAKETAEADEKAGNWLLLLMSPCVVGYAIWSLVHERHNGWYGWIISSLYGLVFTLGFVAMTPQLFINYRLKSVEHMAWRTLIYRALNTFIDDLFAFVITMPTMHRLSTFRDDIVFFIFLYQRYIYPSDKSRSVEPEEQESVSQNTRSRKAAKKEN